ncbi:aldo/keto reductase [Phenylobacterium sp.]|uniref:aldo/keto reductase n=1 Tax=Phenylobacterium sp. TaxID=1871053 RepID=UPI00301CCE94
MIPRVPFGRTGAEISAVGLGLAGLPGGATPDEDATGFTAMNTALDLGVNFFDTADRYGNGRNEELLGRFLKTVDRDRVVVCTKYGSIAAGPDGLPAVDNSPAHIFAACEASLKRLGVDVIDVYYMHRRDPEVPVADSVGAMSRLVEQGKVRWLGLSEVAAKTLRDAHAVHPISAVESEYSLWHRDVETEVLPACRELGVTFVPFSPLGRAFLTGKLTTTEFAPTDLRATLPRFQADAMAKNRAVVEKLAAFAAERGVTAGQIALAWLLSRGTQDAAVVPIPGSKRPANITENCGATAVNLGPEDILELDGIFAPGTIVGHRYSEIEAARAGL